MASPKRHEPENGVARPTGEELETYPLARATGWKAKRALHQGMLFLYPPTKSIGDRQHLRLQQGVEAIDPMDYNYGVGEMLHDFYRDVHRPNRNTNGRTLQKQHARNRKGERLKWIDDNL